MQYSYSDLGQADHDAVGPDAVDVILWGLTRGLNHVEEPRDSAAIGAAAANNDRLNQSIGKLPAAW